jgi:hypothetical protein
MSVPYGEGVQGDTFGAFPPIPKPTFDLIEPTTAPADMLERVRVNTEGRCLETDTSHGTIAVEMYWKPSDGPEDAEARGDFYAPLTADIDPDAKDNPLATQANPYTILPDGSLYEVVFRVPLAAVDTAWSENRSVDISGKSALLGGVSLAQFRRAWPSVGTDLPEGQYTIQATERTKPVLAIATRVENGEPLRRLQKINGATVSYTEMAGGGFMHSMLRPDTAVMVEDSRVTIHADNPDQADKQRLEFRAHDGFQRTGEGAAEHSGVVEAIILEAEAVKYSDFTFTPYTPFKLASPSRPGYDTFGYGVGYSGPVTRGGPVSYGPTASRGGLSGGETRYRPPETVAVNVEGVRNMRAIAAFRFAMAAQRPE